MTTLPIGTDFQARQEAREKLGRLLRAALRRGQREVQAADDAAKAPYLPSNPALMRELRRCLDAAQHAAIREYDRSPKCVSCDRPSLNRLCSDCKEIV